MSSGSCCCLGLDLPWPLMLILDVFAKPLLPVVAKLLLSVVVTSLFPVVATCEFALTGLVSFGNKSIGFEMSSGSPLAYISSGFGFFLIPFGPSSSSIPQASSKLIASSSVNSRVLPSISSTTEYAAVKSTSKNFLT